MCYNGATSRNLPIGTPKNFNIQLSHLAEQGQPCGEPHFKHFFYLPYIDGPVYYALGCQYRTWEKLKIDIFERLLVGYCAVMGKPLIQNLKRIGLHLEVAQVT